MFRRGVHEPADGVVELAAGVSCQLLFGPGRRLRPLVAPSGSHDVERVDDGHDSAAEADVVTAESERVATAVETLVNEKG